MTLRSSRSNDLADAAQAIAKVNHYMVGFADLHMCTLEDFQEANATLIDRELHSMRRGNRTKIKEQYDLAFLVLDAACFALHNAHLTH